VVSPRRCIHRAARALFVGAQPIREQRPDFPWWGVKKWILNILERIFSRSAIPSLSLPLSPSRVPGGMPRDKEWLQVAIITSRARVCPIQCHENPGAREGRPNFATR